MSVKQVKTVLLSIGYGAGITAWRFAPSDNPEKPYKAVPAAIHETLGVKSEAFEKALMNKKIVSLKSELVAISERMLDEAKQVKSKDLLINVRDLPLLIKDEDGKEISKAKQKAHIVQGIESQLLVSLISHLSRGRKNGRDMYVVLGLHDGCISRVWKDPKELQVAVAGGRTKIDIKIDCKQYKLMDLTRNPSQPER